MDLAASGCQIHTPHKRGEHESSRIFETEIRKSEGAGSAASLPGCGVSPQKPLFRASPQATRGKREAGHSPTPQAKGWLPFAIPLVKALDVYRTSVRKIRDDSRQLTCRSSLVARCRIGTKDQRRDCTTERRNRLLRLLLN